MSTPTSSPSSSVIRKRVVASPRNAEDLKLRMANVDDHRNGLHGVGLVSPLTDLMSSSPSQLQPLTPDVHGRHFGGPSSTWTLSSNLLSNSNRSSHIPQSNPTTSAAVGSKAKAPPALDIVSPITTSTSRHSVVPQGRGSLPDLPTRKDAPSSSVDMSAERCALSPSSAGGGRSSAFTPTFETSNNNSSLAQHRASASTFSELTTTPPPNAPRSYSRRTGGARDSVPAPRPSLGSGLRTAAANTNSESPTRRSAEAYSPLLQPRNQAEAMTLTRTGGAPIEYDVPRSGPMLSDYPPYRSAVVGPAGVRAPMAATSTPSAPVTPSLDLRGRTLQTESILATSTQNSNSNGAGGFTLVGPEGGSSCGSHRPTSSATPSHRGKTARAPRLASHLFLDGATPNSTGPPSGLQSPALTEGRRQGSRSSSARARSRGSSEGRVSISTDETHAAFTPVFSTSRPNALNFARGELIGKGSFGAVYRGLQRTTNRIICMKEIRLPGIVEELQRQQQQTGMVAEDASPRGSSSSAPPVPSAPTSADAKEKAAVLKQMEGVRRELALLKQLNHPNIVKYLNHEVVDGHLRLYMEYVSGGSVASAVRTYGSFEELPAAALCYQLLQGLAYLHSRGIVHRDLKGDNLLLETSSALKIADFGTAKSIIASATMTANIVGTAYFMAPEVLRPDGVAGTAADIWSTGCCVVEMLTGKPPLSDIPNQYSVMMTIAGSPTVPLDKYIPKDNTWSSEVLDFIKQCLRLNPASRPTALELLQHPWIRKFCDSVAGSDAATIASSTTPTLAPMDSPRHPRASTTRSHRARDRGSQPTSPDVVITATPDVSVARTPAASPRLPSRSGSANAKESAPTSATPRDRRGKREKKASVSRRTRAPDAHVESGGVNGGYGRENSVSANGTLATPSPPPPPPATTARTSLTSQSSPLLSGGTTTAAIASTTSHLPVARPTGELFGKSHYLGGPSNLSAKEDDRQQSFSYEYPLPSPARTTELSAQPSANFLPAIPGVSSSSANAVPASAASSIDGLRGNRFSRHQNVASSRDDTRAYQYPNEDGFASRESMRMGKEFFLDAPDYGRDGADGSVRYGSTARMPLPDSGLEPGLYSTLDCLVAPLVPEETQPPATSRRSTSKRAGARNTL